VATIIYAVVGIPLTLLTITHIGGFMATSFRFLYRAASTACSRRWAQLLTRRRRPPTNAETDRKRKWVDECTEKALFTVHPVDFDRDESPTGNANCAEVVPISGGAAPETIGDVIGDVTDDDDEDNDKQLPVDGGAVAVNSCVAAVGVAMASVYYYYYYYY